MWTKTGRQANFRLTGGGRRETRKKCKRTDANIAIPIPNGAKLKREGRGKFPWLGGVSKTTTRGVKRETRGRGGKGVKTGGVRKGFDAFSASGGVHEQQKGKNTRRKVLHFAKGSVPLPSNVKAKRFPVRASTQITLVASGYGKKKKLWCGSNFWKEHPRTLQWQGHQGQSNWNRAQGGKERQVQTPRPAKINHVVR